MDVNTNVNVDNNNNNNDNQNAQAEQPTREQLLQEVARLRDENANLANTIEGMRNDREFVSNLEAQSFAIDVAMRMIQLRRAAREEKVNWFDIVNNPMIGGQLTPPPKQN